MPNIAVLFETDFIFLLDKSKVLLYCYLIKQSASQMYYHQRVTAIIICLRQVTSLAPYPSKEATVLNQDNKLA